MERTSRIFVSDECTPIVTEFYSHILPGNIAQHHIYAVRNFRNYIERVFLVPS